MTEPLRTRVSLRERVRRALWHHYEIDPKAAHRVLVNRSRPLRNTVLALRRHWLKHWKWWINILALWTTIAIAVAELIRCE
jgi:hypothetical protein